MTNELHEQFTNITQLQLNKNMVFFKACQMPMEGVEALVLPSGGLACFSFALEEVVQMQKHEQSLFQR